MNILYADLLVSLEGNNNYLYFNWCVEKCGFGQLYFKEENGKVICENELMSRNFIIKIINHFVDSLIMVEENIQNKINSWKDLVIKVEVINEDNTKALCFNNVCKESIREELINLVQESILST